MDTVVIGGAGFVGSHLVDRLLADGHSVDVVDDLSTGSLANLAEARAASGGALRINTIDATGPGMADLIGLRQPRVIYHLAGLVPGDPDRQRVVLSSIASTLAVLEVAATLDQPKVVVLLPAVSVYGDVPLSDQPAKEGRPWTPVDARGVVARAIAELLQVYRDSAAVEFTVLVAPVVYGPRQRPEGGVVAAFVDAARRGVAPRIAGDGRQQRELLYVDDAADALLRAATRADGLIVNLGSGQTIAIRDLWKLVAPHADAEPVHGPAQPADVARLTLAAARARLHLGWAAWTTPAEGIAELLALPAR